NVRLLLLNVIELPPNGSDEQSACVELSDHRTLDLVLRFRSPWPTVQVTYQDPSYVELGSANIESADYKLEAETPTLPESSQRTAKLPTLNDRRQRLQTRLKQSLTGWRFWFRPATLTALFALILIAVVAFLYLRAPAPGNTASALLARAVSAE